MRKLSKKKTSKKSSAIEQFSGTAVGALVEDFDSKLSVVAEDVLGLHKKVDGISDDLETVKSDLETVKSNVVIMASDLETVKSNVDIIKMDIEFIKHDLRKKVSYDDFVALEKRVAIIENKI